MKWLALSPLYDGVFTYGYDAESRLVSVKQGGTTVASYTYDAQGRRKSKTAGSTTTLFVTDADNRKVVEYDGVSGALGRWYAFGQGPDAVLGQMNVAAGTRKTMIPDIQGSIIGTLDSGTGALAKSGYQSFGENPSVTTGTYRYTARRFDPETAGSASQPSGLYYYRARTYSPAWGRFLEPDPLGYAAGPNLYAYVNNDPLNLTDPFGLCDNPQGCGGGGSQVLSEPGLISPCIECLVIPALRLPRILGVLYDVYQLYQNLPSTAPSLQAPPANTAPNFIVSPSGTVFPVPRGAQGPVPVVNPAGNQTGVAFTGGNGGANGQVSTIRIMNPTPPRGNAPGYPNGYVVYQNSTSPTPTGSQPIHRTDRSIITAHFPIQ